MNVGRPFRAGAAPNPFVSARVVPVPGMKIWISVMLLPTGLNSRSGLNGWNAVV
jgi:hypothetical protein